MAIVTGKLSGVTGGPGTTYINGTIDVALCGYGSCVPRCAVGSFAQLTDLSIPVDENAAFEFEVNGNDGITPAGTYYTVTFRNANGDIAQVNAYRFLGGNNYDLNTLDPFDPNQPPPPLPPLITNLLQILAAADNMFFDGSAYTAFKTTLNGDVTQPVFQNMIPGNLYTFIIMQDGTGGHAFAWAGNVYNPTPIDRAPNSTTIQTFVADEFGNLYAIGPGTYYP